MTMTRKHWLTLTICTVMVAAQAFLFFVAPKSYGAFFDVIRPMIYMILLVFALVGFGKNQKNFSGQSTLTMVSILGLVLFLCFNFAAGLLTNFANNAMSGTIMVALKNAWAFLVPLVIREILRFKMMSSFSDKWKYRMCLAIMLIFTFCTVDNLPNIIKFDIWQQVDWLFTSLLPAMTLNLWLSYAAMNGGLKGNLIYAGMTQALILFSPVLPDTQTILDAIATYAIVFLMFIVYDSIEWAAKRQSGGEVKVRGKRQWWVMIFPGAALAICVMFGLGIFPIIPVAVASESMNPEFRRGDMVYVVKTHPDELKIGDILQYTRSGISIIHRITAIQRMPDGRRYFVTKGDNNPNEDRWPVYDEQVLGVGAARTPFLGWPALLFQELK